MVRVARVGIIGSYGGYNLGDEAILHGMLAMLRRSAAVEVTVFTRNAEDTLRRHEVEHAVEHRTRTRAEVRAEIEPLDLLILGGGGILFDAVVTEYLREVGIAHEVGVPVMVYAVGVGPLTDPTAREMVRTHLNRAAAVTVRDRHALHLLEEIGVEREIVVTADPAFLLEPEPIGPAVLEREGLRSTNRLFGISVREPGPAAPGIELANYHELVANAADFVVERLGARVVFVPLERTDVQHGHGVASRMRNSDRAVVLKGEYSSGQMLSLMGHFDFAMGMRLHFLIFAVMQGVPFVALPYAAKVSALLEELQLAAPPLGEVSAGQFIARVDRSWDMRAEIRDRLQRHLPELRARARQTNEIVLDLLRGEGARRSA